MALLGLAIGGLFGGEGTYLSWADILWLLGEFPIVVAGKLLWFLMACCYCRRLNLNEVVMACAHADCSRARS
jgi:hypothetical protein